MNLTVFGEKPELGKSQRTRYIWGVGVERAFTLRGSEVSMNQQEKTELLLPALCVFALIIAAFFSFPYFFYILLRLFICAASVFFALRSHSGKKLFLTWSFGALAVLFNPVLPIRMSRNDWQVVNMLAAIFFVSFVVYSNRAPILSVLRCPASISLKEWAGTLLAAQRGKPEAQNTLGRLYDIGFGMKMDHEQAALWYQRAASQGYATAQFNLASLYYSGEGVPKDYALAATWYRKAAEQNYINAQTRLAMLYANGKGVKKDPTQARHWYGKAAEQGDSFAQTCLAVLYANGTGVPQNYALAAEWYRKAAEQNNAIAQTGLGALFFSGNGVPKDCALAAFWYQKAAEQGDKTAQTNLGSLYFYGDGVPENHEVAATWFRKAAEQGYAQAQAWLGQIYTRGEGVPKDDAMAVYWITKAADQQDAWAQFLLGTAYEEGWGGVPMDLDHAKELFQLSAANGNALAEFHLNDKFLASKAPSGKSSRSRPYRNPRK